MSRVVIIGRGQTSRSIIAQSLLSQGFEIEEKESAEQALPHLFSTLPAAVIADVDASPVSGFQIARFLRNYSRFSDTRIILYAPDVDRRDEFWSRESGADLILSLDPDTVESFSSRVLELIDDAEGDTEGVAEGESTRATEELAPENLFSSLMEVNEEHLFRLSMNNYLREVGKSINSIEETARKILEVLQSVMETHIAVLIIRYRREAKIFSLPSEQIYRKEAEDFTELCLDDFNRQEGAENIRNSERSVFGTEDREDYDRTRIDGKRLSSYYMGALTDAAGNLVGSLHAGNLTNNYFTGRTGRMFDSFAEAASLVIQNSVLYNETAEMRQKIEHIFAKFVPREVIRDLLGQSEDAELQLGEKRRIAVLFSDIRSFTVISEHNTAEDVVDFLNRFLDRMSQAIRTQGGFIDKFIGDAILAVFGAPISYENNAERAVRAALDMKNALPEIDTGRLVLPDKGFDIGIGVHEGPVIVGNLGSRDKFDYTVIGDNVNLASRLEGLTKYYHQHIIVSDALAASLEENIVLREVDTVKVKGKEQATTLYSVLDELYFDEENMRNYQKGLSMFKLGNWKTAQNYFEKLLERYPEDFLCSLYRDRCIEYAGNPPEDWDGAVKLDFK